MGSIHPVARQKIFEPATCEALGVAFETAWQRLLVSGRALASSRYADATREALSPCNIIDLAQRGERNVNRLQEMGSLSCWRRWSASTPPAGMTNDTVEVDMKNCPDCSGDGVNEKGTHDEMQCPTCRGSGFVPDDNDDKNNEEVIRTSTRAAGSIAKPR
jgi:hypothetical protein